MTFLRSLMELYEGVNSEDWVRAQKGAFLLKGSAGYAYFILFFLYLLKISPCISPVREIKLTLRSSL